MRANVLVVLQWCVCAVQLTSPGREAQVRKQYASLTGGGQIQMFHWRTAPFSAAVRLPVFTAETAQLGVLGSGVNGQVLWYATCEKGRALVHCGFAWLLCIRGYSLKPV